MSRKAEGDSGDEEMAADHWEFDIDRDDPEIDVVEAVAELEGADSDDLSPLYNSIDHLVENLFSNPPPAEAQARLEFTYEGYRIVMNQDGHATFMKIAEDNGDS